MYLTF